MNEILLVGASRDEDKVKSFIARHQDTTVYTLTNEESKHENHFTIDLSNLDQLTTFSDVNQRRFTTIIIDDNVLTIDTIQTPIIPLLYQTLHPNGCLYANANQIQLYHLGLGHKQVFTIHANGIVNNLNSLNDPDIIIIEIPMTDLQKLVRQDVPVEINVPNIEFYLHIPTGSYFRPTYASSKRELLIALQQINPYFIMRYIQYRFGMKVKYIPKLPISEFVTSVSDIEHHHFQAIKNPEIDIPYLEGKRKQNRSKHCTCKKNCKRSNKYKLKKK